MCTPAALCHTDCEREARFQDITDNEIRSGNKIGRNMIQVLMPSRRVPRNAHV